MADIMIELTLVGRRRRCLDRPDEQHQERHSPGDARKFRSPCQTRAVFMGSCAAGLTRVGHALCLRPWSVCPQGAAVEECLETSAPSESNETPVVGPTGSIAVTAGLS